MPRITQDSLVCQSSTQTHHHIDQEVVFLSTETWSYYGTDLIGGFVWSLLEKPILVRDICQQLIQEYEVEQEQCLEDILAFLDQLIDVSLITLLE